MFNSAEHPLIRQVSAGAMCTRARWGLRWGLGGSWSGCSLWGHWLRAQGGFRRRRVLLPTALLRTLFAEVAHRTPIHHALPCRQVTLDLHRPNSWVRTTRRCARIPDR